MARFVDYPVAKILAWLDALPHGRMPKRAWAKFTDFAYAKWGDFAELTGSGGFSGSPKLLAVCAALEDQAKRDRFANATVGDVLAHQAETEAALGFLPPVGVAEKVVRAAGRKDLAAAMRAIDSL